MAPQPSTVKKVPSDIYHSLRLFKRTFLEKKKSALLSEIYRDHVKRCIPCFFDLFG